MPQKNSREFRLFVRTAFTSNFTAAIKPFIPTIPRMIRPLITFLPVLTCVALAEEAVLPVTIKTPPGQMRYDLGQFDVTPGQKVKLTLENNDEMPHNLVLCKPSNNDKGLEVAKKAWEMGEKGIEKDWVPVDPRVLVGGKMAPPHGKQVYEFTAPTELGDYPYVCTFPGHAMSMNGIMRVATSGPKVKDLNFKLHLGSWDKLPDFTTLTPHRTGPIPEGLIGWKFDDYKNQFGMEFAGKITAAKKGKYKFFLASDDGAEIFIDGKSILKRDGIHPSGEPQARELPLDAGDHIITVNYFQQAGEAELYVAWQGPGFSETPLSKWVPAGRKDPSSRKEEKNLGIPLGPENGEAVVYRNFIEGSSPRAIAVGYPGGLNLCFDADQMNLAMLWRGAFIDAKRHWTDRGGGNQPPLGYAVAKPVSTAAGVAVLADPNTTAWPAKTPRAEGLEFHGYKLDAKRFPTFSYSKGGLKIEESYQPVGTDADPKAKLIRIIKLSGSAEPNTFLRVASGPFKPEGDHFNLGTDLVLTVEGTTAQPRQNDIILPLNPATSKEIRITYQWAN